MKHFGLAQHHKDCLIESFKTHLTPGTVIVYGSRVQSNFTEHSDIDLVIQDTGHTDRHILAELQDHIDESNFPYLCDIQYLDSIKNPTLRDHIAHMGQVLFHSPDHQSVKAISK